MRFAKPIDNTIDLPILTPEDLYKVHPSAYGVEIELRPDFKSEISPDLIMLGLELWEEKQKLMSPFTLDVMKLLKEYINSMALSSTNEFLKEAFKKLTEKITQYQSLGTKSDENISQIIDIRYKPLMTLTEKNLEYIKKILEKQNNYFLRFMNTVSLRRMPDSL